jgi:hypothetical protein
MRGTEYIKCGIYPDVRGNLRINLTIFSLSKIIPAIVILHQTRGGMHRVFFSVR